MIRKAVPKIVVGGLYKPLPNLYQQFSIRLGYTWPILMIVMMMFVVKTVMIMTVIKMTVVLQVMTIITVIDDDDDGDGDGVESQHESGQETCREKHPWDQLPRLGSENICTTFFIPILYYVFHNFHFHNWEQLPRLGL